MYLAGKKALITGSRRGIGRGIAVALAKEGADIGINDVEEDDAAEDTLELVRREGRKVSWHLADISKASEVNRMIDEFLEQHNSLDILVNNGVFSIRKNFLEITEQDWDTRVGVNLKGYFLCSQRAAQEMVNRQQGGSIVNISSVHAFRAWPDDMVYGMCKAALLRMTRSMALDLSGHNINCNSVAPGYIDSRVLSSEQEHMRGGEGYQFSKDWIPARRAGVPDDIANVVMFLCSTLGEYINGECITVDGGLMTGGTPPID